MDDASLRKTRSYLEQIFTWITGRGKILIVVHDNPDPDCFASAMALRHLLVMKLNREPVIAFSGMIARSENLAMAKELEIPLTPLPILDLNDFSAIWMLDTQPQTGNNSLPPEISVDIVIDHHPMRETSKQCRWIDIREDYGVTATILYEYLVAMDIYIGTKLATALFYAIKSETQDLGREANRPDREAYLKLFPLTNKKLLYEITHPRLPVEYFVTIHKALENTKVYGTTIVSNLQRIAFPEIVAEIADLLVRLEEVNTCLCLGHYSDDIIVSMRTNVHEINAGEVIRRIIDGRGKAGGHGMTAGGKIDGIPPTIEAIAEVEDFLTEGLLAEFGIKDVPRRLLIGSG